MGARINFVFKTDEFAAGEPESYVVLYSHWGQDSWQPDLAEALQHARRRWDDASYGTRMIISYLIQHNILDETGFGIYAISDISMDLGEQTVIVDLTNNTITDIHPVEFEAFINAYAPRVLTEQVIGQGHPVHIMRWGQDYGGLAPSLLLLQNGDMMSRVTRLRASKEEKVATTIGRLLSDFSLDLEAVGKYLATANPYVVYARAVEVLESAEYNKTTAEYREIGKYYGNDLFQ